MFILKFRKNKTYETSKLSKRITNKTACAITDCNWTCRWKSLSIYFKFKTTRSTSYVFWYLSLTQFEKFNSFFLPCVLDKLEIWRLYWNKTSLFEFPVSDCKETAKFPALLEGTVHWTSFEFICWIGHSTLPSKTLPKIYKKKYFLHK